MNPVRILMAVSIMNRGGMETRLMDIYRHIDREKLQFDFYTCRKEQGYYDDEIKSLGGKVYYNSPLSPQGMRQCEKRLKKFLEEHREYRILHAHMNQWCGILLKAAKNAGVPVRIAHARTALETGSLKNMVKNVIKKPVNKYATHCFAVSKKAGVWLFGKKAWEEGRIEVWPNAIDCQAFLPDPNIRKQVRKELGIKDEFTIVHTGNLRPEKNHPFLFQVFREILYREPNARLILAGKEDERKYYRSLAEKLGISPLVQFLGVRSDIAEILQAGDCFIFPSLYEGLPGAVMEAQASGLPCLISDTITEEVCITPLVTRMSLKAPTEEWARLALSHRGDTREVWKENFEKTGFDIHILTEKLTEFYLSLGE